MGNKVKSLIGAALAPLLFAGAALAQDGVTFQDVMANPDDPELNLAYAEQRIEAGDLLSAAATLERLLFIEPNWHEARILYAGVLYRLGDYAAAKRELDVLDGQVVSESLQAEIAEHQARIDPATGRTRFGGRLAIGMGYDEKAGTLLVEDAEGLIQIESVDQYSFVARSVVTIEHDLQEASNLRLFGRLDGYTKQFEDDEFDGYAILRAKGGLKGSTLFADWTANFSARNISIRGTNYLTEYGVELAADHDFNARTSAGVRLGYHYQEFEAVFDDAVLNEGQTGERYDVSVIGRHAFTAKLRGSAAINYRDKSANTEDFSYQFTGGQAGLDAYFGPGLYLDNDLVYRDYSYNGTFGGTGDREDQLTYLRSALGVPLSAVFGNGLADRLTAEIAIYHTRRDSTVEAFEYDSTGGEARLVWRFGQ